MKRLNGFSLMEMMVVLLIVAVVAAASAPMITKKMTSSASSSSSNSPWVRLTGSTIAYNLEGKNNTAIIGSHSAPNPLDRSRLHIVSNNDDRPHITLQHANVDGITKIMSRGKALAITTNNFKLGDNSVTIGGSRATGANSLAMGIGANASARDTIAIGNTVMANNTGSIAIGSNNTTAEGNFGIAIGNRSLARAQGAIAIGGGFSGANVNQNTAALKADSIALGTLAHANSSNSIAIGNYARVALAEGNSAPNAANSIAFGAGANVVNGSGESIAIGTKATVGKEISANRSIAIGAESEVRSIAATAVGTKAKALNDLTIALGADATANATSAIVIGARSTAAHKNSVAIGNGVNTFEENTIYIGADNQKVVISGDLVVGGNVLLNSSDTAHRTYACDDNGYFMVQRVTPSSPNGTGTGSGGFDNVGTMNSYLVQGFDEPAINHTVFGDKDLIDELMSGIIKPGGGTHTAGDGYSDRRLKNVGKGFEGGLKELKKLDVYHYTFKNDKDKTPRVGVMAQDLQKIFPDAVFKGEDGFFRIRMEDMFYAVINAVKELDAKFDLLAQKQKKIDELEKRIERLEKQLERLEKNK